MDESTESTENVGNPIIEFANRHGFSSPVKKITDPADIAIFRQTIAYDRLTKLIQAISLAVRLKKVPISTENASVNKVVNLLKNLSVFVDETPALSGPRRFGNMAFRYWFDKLERLVQQDKALSTQLNEASPELRSPLSAYEELNYYFLGSFGSKERLDFGTGHELSFLAFLGGLYSLKILTHVEGEDWLLLFSEYFELIRKLVRTYTLEPAGSHGVWGLDDHFHLPYILGSAQIVDFTQPDAPSPDLPPKSILLPKNVALHAKDNLYFGAINFILEVKKGPFFEHSPILYDITGVPTWHKIYRGMVKMYLAEVLGKYTVVQHFYFGSSLYPWLDLNERTLPCTSSAQDDENENET